MKSLCEASVGISCPCLCYASTRTDTIYVLRRVGNPMKGRSFLFGIVLAIHLEYHLPFDC